MKKTFVAALVILTTLGMIACSKEGTQGPAGPAGPTGPVGPAGPTGSANVTAVLFNAPAWTGSQININVPQITNDIYNNGLVLSYMEFSSVPNVYYHVPGFVVNASYQVRVYHQSGNMRFNLLNPDGTAPGGVLPAVSKLKVLIIPAATVVNGRTISSRQAILNQLQAAGVDINNYDEVRNYFGLDE